MTADGEFLSGYFAWAFRNRAHNVIAQGWNRFEQLAEQNNWNPQPVPTDKLDHTLGARAAGGNIKLEVAVRDLPRGNVLRPGRNAFQRDAYNLSWIDLSPSDVESIVTESSEQQRVPQSVLLKLSTALKDCVRGQCGDWNQRSQREGQLFTQNIGSEGDRLTMRITGRGDFSGDGRAYNCQLHGRAVFDKSSRRLSELTIVASGQRRGKAGANDRGSDPGPAPMGVAFRLFQ